MSLPGTNCDTCNEKISWNMERFSMNRYRKPLCIKCQKKEIWKTYLSKLAKMAVKRLDEYRSI